MKTLYLECAMGAAGDMLMGALYELCPEKERFLRDMNRLLPGLTLEAESAVRQGIAGTHMRVTIRGREEAYGGHFHSRDHSHDFLAPDHEHDHDRHHDVDREHDHHHEHHSLADVETLIDSFFVPEKVRSDAKHVYALIARAEADAHGVEPGQVHFHEVGALDAVADVTGVCYLLYLLAPDTVAASPVTVGSGTVHTAHGVLPVPAPATVRLLSGVPIVTGDIAAELCTPTGAALLKTFASSFGPIPAGILLRCGYGCGTKDFPRANCLRAFLLETAETAGGPSDIASGPSHISGNPGQSAGNPGGTAGGPNDMVTELKANIDDMTGEALGFAMERLLEAGALDVSYLPLQMKKDRPGVLLTCLCRPADADRLAVELLRHTATFGVRRTDCPRYALTPGLETVDTALGPIKRKTGTGYGFTKRKPEYEDLAAAAKSNGLPLEAVREVLDRVQ